MCCRRRTRRAGSRMSGRGVTEWRRRGGLHHLMRTLNLMSLKHSPFFNPCGNGSYQILPRKPDHIIQEQLPEFRLGADSLEIGSEDVETEECWDGILRRQFLRRPRSKRNMIPYQQFPIKPREVRLKIYFFKGFVCGDEDRERFGCGV